MQDFDSARIVPCFENREDFFTPGVRHIGTKNADSRIVQVQAELINSADSILQAYDYDGVGPAIKTGIFQRLFGPCRVFRHK